MRLGLAEVEVEESGEKRRLSKPEWISLLLILASVALWYIGYIRIFIRGLSVAPALYDASR